MAVGRAQRRAERAAAFHEVFGEKNAAVALDLVELLELAWHDCYGEITPPETIIDDLLVCSEGRLDGLIRAAHVAVTDWRDLRMWADRLRSGAS
jgi:hypothetical protein